MSASEVDPDRVHGHAWIRAALAHQLARQEVAPAYLFAGPDGIGKRRIALGFLRDFLCLRPAEGRACGTCAACRAAAREAHPDLHVAPSKKSGSGRLEIGILREEVIERFALTPKLSLRRGVVIDGAETLSEEAQNALLKTLEEPPLGACLILVASSETALLPTILSRARLVRFGRPTRDEGLAILASELEGSESEERMREALRVADDSPGAALELLSSASFSSCETFAAWIREGAPPPAELRELLPGLEAGSGHESTLPERRERLRELWRLTLLVAGRELRSAHGVEPQRPSDSTAGDERELDAARGALAESARRWCELGLRALEDLESMVTPELSFELWAAGLPRAAPRG